MSKLEFELIILQLLKIANINVSDNAVFNYDDFIFKIVFLFTPSTLWNVNYQQLQVKSLYSELLKHSYKCRLCCAVNKNIGSPAVHTITKFVNIING